MLEINGSYGEGGGQILRSALALSAILTIPVRIYNIRANRPKPGLRPQHLTGVLAMAEVTGAGLTGVDVGAGEIIFRPGTPRPGEYFFDVSKTRGSAGSVTLVMQTVLPALAHTGGPSRVTLIGGTHVPWSPSYHYFEGSFLTAARKLGLKAEVSIEKWGFYPKGGGKVALRVDPSDEFSPVDLTERGSLMDVKGISAVANLPEGIALRQARSAEALMRARGLDARVEIVNAPSAGEGTFVYLSAGFEKITLGFSALGERGKRAEAVGEEAARALLNFMATDAAVEERLADQLVLYMALAKGVSRMTVPRITRHLLTNIWLIKQFLPNVKIEVTGSEGGKGAVVVEA